MKHLALIATLAIAAAAQAQTPAPTAPAPKPGAPVTMLYVFGDSYSDSGSGYADTNGLTAVAYKIDQAFRPRERVVVQVTFEGNAGTRYVAHGTPYKPRDRDASLRFKRARYSSYRMMRSKSP